MLSNAITTIMTTAMNDVMIKNDNYNECYNENCIDDCKIIIITIGMTCVINNIYNDV